MHPGKFREGFREEGKMISVLGLARSQVLIVQTGSVINYVLLVSGSGDDEAVTATPTPNCQST